MRENMSMRGGGVGGEGEKSLADSLLSAKARIGAIWA